MTEVQSHPVTKLEQQLKRYEPQLLKALPNIGMSAERFARIVMTEVSKNPALQDCDPRSFFGACIQAAQLGLMPGIECYLIPFKRQCQMILGFKGMISLAARSGLALTIQPRAVFDKDIFSYQFGLEEKLIHEPKGRIRTADKLTHVYAVAPLVDGRGKLFDVMTKNEVDEIRARSQAKNSGPWVTDYVAMAMKTVVRRLFKYVPVSTEQQRLMATAIEIDEKTDAGEPADFGGLIDAEYTVKQETKEENQARRKVTSAEKAKAAAAAVIKEAEPLGEPGVRAGPPPPPVTAHQWPEHMQPVQREPAPRDAQRDDMLVAELTRALEDCTEAIEIGLIMRRAEDLPPDMAQELMRLADETADRLTAI